MRAVAPFTLEGEHVRFEGLCFLPDFGGHNGVLGYFGDLSAQETEEERAQRHVFQKLAASRGYFWSALNSRSPLSERLVKETLDDWGYFGPPERMPTWYAGIPWSEQPPRTPKER